MIWRLIRCAYAPLWAQMTYLIRLRLTPSGRRCACLTAMDGGNACFAGAKTGLRSLCSLVTWGALFEPVGQRQTRKLKKGHPFGVTLF
jgi:hypothetical protein